MKNICLVSWGDHTNLKIWSGTPYYLGKILSEKGFVVDYINEFSYLKGWKNILWHILDKMGFLGNEKKPIIFQMLSHGVRNRASELKPNSKILFVSSNVLNKPLRDDIDAYIYVDSCIRPILTYAPQLKFPRSVIRKFSIDLYEKYDKKSYSHAKKIFTQNEWSRDYILKHYNCQPNNVINVGVGVNLKLFNGEKDFSRNLLLIVLRKGAYIEQTKGLHILLPAYRIAQKTIPNLKLAVVGTDGKEEEGVTYYYEQPREITERLFQECSLYTMPAIREPNGVTFLEALANKTPFLGLGRYAVPEFAGYGKYGFYTKGDSPEEVASLIIEALSNVDRLKKMGEEGQRFVAERYTWEKVVASMLNEMD